MENKQTAVEWLVEDLTRLGHNFKLYKKEIEQAKEMEKEQIINALGVGCQIKPTGLIGYYEMGEQYYNETYGK